MKENIFPAIRLTAVSILVFAVAYTVVMLGIGSLGPGGGEGRTLAVNGRIVGFADEGQSFTADNYFNGRPSAVSYNGAGSGGSNKGPSNPDYLLQVKDRIDSILVHNPGLTKEQIPAEMVTASGSGLDPDISAESALMQVKRVAKARNISEAKLKELISARNEKPVFGPAHINVLKLNIELDKIK